MGQERVQAGLNAKLSRPWTGSYIVSRVISSTNVEIRDPSTVRRIPPIHVNDIKPCPHDVRLESAQEAGRRGQPADVEIVEVVPEVGNKITIAPVAHSTIILLG